MTKRRYTELLSHVKTEEGNITETDSNFKVA
jgi:hypothetical protein